MQNIEQNRQTINSTGELLSFSYFDIKQKCMEGVPKLTFNLYMLEVKFKSR